MIVGIIGIAIGVCIARIWSPADYDSRQRKANKAFRKQLKRLRAK